MNWWKTAVCALFGYLGVHKFMEKKIGMGFLYLFTLGLFGLGWIADTIRHLVIAIKGVKNRGRAALIWAILLLVLFKAGMSSPEDMTVGSSPTPSANIQLTASTESTLEVEYTPNADETASAILTEIPTDTPTPEPTEKVTPEPTEAPTKKPTAAPTQDEGQDYIANKNSKIFHETDCGNVKRMKESNKVYFHGTREDAIARGYQPCKNCNP